MQQIRPRSASGFIVVGGTAQVLMAANLGRMGWWLQNTSGGDLWIDDGDASNAAKIALSGITTDSFRVAAGATYASPIGAASTNAISIWGATSGQTYSCREF
jgi:hypothetical protein